MILPPFSNRYKPAVGGRGQLHKPAQQDARGEAPRQGDAEQGQGAAVGGLSPQPDEGGDEQEGLREPREAEEERCKGLYYMYLK